MFDDRGEDFDLRNPSFVSREPFFGPVDTGVRAALFFEVDTASIEIVEHSDDGPLTISLSEPRLVPIDGLCRVEVSSDLRMFFSLHERMETQPFSVFSERNATE